MLFIYMLMCAKQHTAPRGIQVRIQVSSNSYFVVLSCVSVQVSTHLSKLYNGVVGSSSILQVFNIVPVIPRFVLHFYKSL